ncbi:hypothetical protein D1872_324630 [compost metagenome]
MAVDIEKTFVAPPLTAESVGKRSECEEVQIVESGPLLLAETLTIFYFFDNSLQHSALFFSAIVTKTILV